MGKSTMIILSIISIILSLAYILLNYFGMIRYASLYIYSIESYSNNYKNLDQINRDNKTIISLITSNKINSLRHTVKSLLDQTVRVDLLSMILPDTSNYELPSDMTKIVALYKCGNEKVASGNLNCLTSTISREGDATTKIITLGLGVIYGKDFIEILLEICEQNPNKIVYVDNGNDLIDLEKGAVFNMSFFNEDFMDIPENVDSNDWVNQYFQNKAIDKVKVSYSQNYRTL